MSLAEPSTPRRMIYALLIVVAAGSVAGRIAGVTRVYEPELARDESNPADRRGKWPAKRPTPLPLFSSNDRSRWATVRALVDDDTYVIGRRDYNTIVGTAVSLVGAHDGLQAATLAAMGLPLRTSSDTGIIFEDGWQSVDKVLDPATLDFYSTKPPLLSTLVAGLYWLLKCLLGWTITGQPYSVVRTILVLVNLVPFVVYLVLLARLLDRCGTTDWGRYFVLACACFATLMTPFLVTLNNHTVATCCVLFAVYAVWPMLQLPFRPAPSAPGGVSWRLVVAGLAASFAATNDLPALAFTALLCCLLIWHWPGQTLLWYVPAALVPLAALLATNYLALGTWQPAYEKFGGPWYQYEGSHWHKTLPDGQLKHGIDWAGNYESRSAYAFHVIVGHHGIFSLSPIWLLAAAGTVLAARALRRQQTPGTAPAEAWMATAAMTLVLTVVVVGYYLVKSDNYGGFTTGLRWLMWLTPLWLLTMVPVVDWLGQRAWGRWLAYGLLAWSVFSMSYPAWNPWRHPWLYNLLESGGYIAY